MRATTLWVLLLLLSFATGYCARARREPAVNPVQFAAADSALRDAKRHVALLELSNHRLGDSLEASDAAIARHQLDMQRSAERAKAAEAQAATVRAQRPHVPAGSGASDSIAVYRAQLETADREAELLRTALEQRWDQLAAKDSIEREQRAQIALLIAAKDSAVADLVRITPVFEEARRAIATSEPRCRGPFGLPCPSRKGVAIGTALTVLAVGSLAR